MVVRNPQGQNKVNLGVNAAMNLRVSLYCGVFLDYLETVSL